MVEAYQGVVVRKVVGTTYPSLKVRANKRVVSFSCAENRVIAPKVHFIGVEVSSLQGYRENENTKAVCGHVLTDFRRLHLR